MRPESKTAGCRVDHGYSKTRPGVLLTCPKSIEKKSTNRFVRNTKTCDGIWARCTVSSPSVGCRRSEVVAQFQRLREELVEHFHYEEEGGFFKDVVERAPRYSEQIDELCQEHVQSLQDLDQMTHDAEVGEPTGEWWDDLSHRFHEFSNQLMNHEARENQLLQNAYGIDLGAND